MRTIGTFATSLFLFCAIPALTVAQNYTVTDLGSLSPTGINSWAQVVGNYNSQAYTWTLGHLRPLGILPGGTFSYAASINDVGSVVGTVDGPGTVLPGGYTGPSQDCSDLTQPFIWKQQQMQALGTVGATDVEDAWCSSPFYAAQINIKGQMVGYTGDLSNEFQWGFLWNSTDGFSLLGDSFPPSMTLGINNPGLIVGEIAVTFSGQATSWKNGVSTDLGGLPDFSYSTATAVNDLGQIVGLSLGPTSTDCCDSHMHAVLWTQSGVISDLGTLSGDTESSAKKINLFGLVIGSSGSTYVVSTIGDNNPRDEGPLEVIGRPFLWSRRRGMQDLNTLIRPNSGWVLQTAEDINVWGQIVGQGTLNGQPHGFLLTPRNPFTF